MATVALSARPSPHERPVEEGDRARLVEIQRGRIVTAMCELAYEAEGSMDSIAVSRIVARSGVSRRTFYELFEDRQDCLLAAFDHAVTQASTAALEIYRAMPEAPWEERLRAGLEAVLVFLDSEPVLGRLAVVGALASGPRLLKRRARIIEQMVEFVHRGAETARRRRTRSANVRRSRVLAEGVVGAVLGILGTRLAASKPKPTVGLLNELMAIVLAPYQGLEAAERELARELPRKARPRQLSSDPLRELDMRLTYRTVRVLGAIAQHPTSSGRKIAQASGVRDPGQISRLLSRLEHLGLVTNQAPGLSRGAPNAWTLTPKGHEVEQATRTTQAV